MYSIRDENKREVFSGTLEKRNTTSNRERPKYPGPNYGKEINYTRNSIFDRESSNNMGGCAYVRFTFVSPAGQKILRYKRTNGVQSVRFRSIHRLVDVLLLKNPTASVLAAVRFGPVYKTTTESNVKTSNKP